MSKAKKFMELIAEKNFEEAKKDTSEINSSDSRYYTPLMTAVQNNDYETAQFLLENGAVADFSMEISPNPLMIAVTQQNSKMVELLLDNPFDNADPNLPSFAQVPLEMAAFNKDIATIILLLKHGAKIDKVKDEVRKALVFETAKCIEGEKKVVELVEKLKGVMKSSEHNKEESIKKLINENKDTLTLKKLDGTTLLMAIAQDMCLGMEIIAELILQKDCSTINCTNQKGETALILSVKEGLNPLTFETLLKYGADCKKQDVQGHNALYYIYEDNVKDNLFWSKYQSFMDAKFEEEFEVKLAQITSVNETFSANSEVVGNLDTQEDAH